MIKLQAHIRHANAETYIKRLADEHWLYLNSKSGKRLPISEKVDEAIREASAVAYLSSIAENSAANQAAHLSFLSDLKFNNYKLLQNLIISRPSGLEKIRKDIFKKTSKLYFVEPKTTLTNGKPVTKLKQTQFSAWLMSKVFNYGSFRRSPQCRDTFGKLGFQSATCPYCNYTMIDIVAKKVAQGVAGKEKAYFEADHFFEKYQHPFLALSFFNLIPSCHNCNAMDKGALSFSLKTHAHPYLTSMDSIYRFRITLQEIHNRKIDQVTLEKFKAGDRTFDDFNILAKYNNNLKSANTIMKKFFNNQHLAGTAAHADFIETVFEEIAASKNAILDYPKSKLHRDILRELDPHGTFGIQHVLSQ